MYTIQDGKQTNILWSVSFNLLIASNGASENIPIGNIDLIKVYKKHTPPLIGDLWAPRSTIHFNLESWRKLSKQSTPRGKKSVN